MIWSLVLLFLIQAIYAAEFPDLLQNIQVIWENVDVAGTLDGSQTVSTDGKVAFFTLCGMFNNTNSNDGYCRYDFSYDVHSSHIIASRTGNGTDSIAAFHSQINETYSCMNFSNYIPSFKEVYDSAEAGTGSWQVKYNCKLNRSLPWEIIVGVLVAGLWIVGGVLGYKYWQKKKKAQQTTYAGASYMAAV